MKRLIIAEKPSVARDIAKLYGTCQREDGYISTSTHDVTWCIGHLIQLAQPKAYGYEKWRLDQLPMKVAEFKLEQNPYTTDQADVVSALLQDDYECVINACDAGREGELIFRYIYQWANSTLPIKRLWVSSLTPSELKAGFANLKEGSDFDGLAMAARSRNEADWIVGLNATRALTLHARARNPTLDTTLSIGRVQTPTLAMIVDRHKERQNFVPKDYWEIWGTFDDFTAKMVDEQGKIQKFDAPPTSLIESLAPHPAQIESIQRQEKDKAPPQLFDLTSLQQAANTKFGFSAMHTLKIAQQLYETHKVLSYPRTDSKHLTPEYAKTINEQLHVAADDLGCARLDKVQLSKRTVDETKVTDHHAIVPTGQPSEGLDDDETKLYGLVTRRTLAAFGPKATVSSTKVTIAVGQARFVAQGTQVIAPGWMAWEKPDKKDGDEDTAFHPALAEGLTISKTLEQKALQTKPKPKLTEASLLQAMERASLHEHQVDKQIKARGIGTPATRASIIETLITRGYVQREKKNLNATNVGIMLVEYLRPFEHLTNPSMTGQWEQLLFDIEQSPHKAKQFINHINVLTDRLVAFIDSQKMRLPQAKPVADCPQCKQHSIAISKRKTSCISCTFAIYNTIAGVQLPSKMILEILQGKTIGPVAGFKGKEDKAFSASIRLGKTKEDKPGIVFVFDAQSTDIVCPACRSQNMGLDAYKLSCPSCKCAIWRNVSGCVLQQDDLKQAIDGKVIGPFKLTSKDKKKFDAKLKLKADHQWEYVFDKKRRSKKK